MILRVMPVPLQKLADGSFALDSLTARGIAVEARANADCGLGATRYLAPVTRSPDGKAVRDLVDIRDIENLEAVGSYALGGGRRDFWLRDLRIWRRDLLRSLDGVDVVSVSAVGDPLRPAPYAALSMAKRRKIPTVAVFGIYRPARVAALEAQQASRGPGGWRPSLEHIEARLSRWAVRRADASVLKVGNANDILGPVARRSTAELLTQYLAAEVLAADSPVVVRQPSQTVRIVYFGQLSRFKRVDEAIRWVSYAGEDFSLTIFGDGPDADRLQALATELSAPVEFRGHVAYGPEFLRQLDEFDVHLFPNPDEDTPRAILDGFARGLPVIAPRTRFTAQLQAEGAPVWFLEEVSANRDAVVADLVGRRRRAVEFAGAHSAERWAGARAGLYRSLLDG